MATIYSATMYLRKKSSSQPKIITFTASDVAGEFWKYPSGDSVMTFSNEPVWITDIIVSSSAGTTKNIQVFVNGSSVIDTMPLANLVGTVYGRPFQANAFVLNGSQSLTIKQLA